jgi:hypothetical protein
LTVHTKKDEDILKMNSSEENLVNIKEADELDEANSPYPNIAK